MKKVIILGTSGNIAKRVIEILVKKVDIPLKPVLKPYGKSADVIEAS